MTLAEIFRRFTSEYLTKHQNILPGHIKAIDAVVKCRTEALGGQVWFCKSCDEHHYSYHSCKNRHCPQCGNDAADVWLEKQQDLLLPAVYFMATFTVPEGLRQFIRSNQKLMYNILFRASASALQILTGDKRFVGGTSGMMGVLQTWTRDLNYHPHIHYLIAGGGLSKDHRKWYRVKNEFLVHIKPLAVIFKAKFKDACKKAGVYDQIPSSVWKLRWGIDIRPVGNGECALKYLAPYIFRIATSNRNIISMDGEKVIFRYKKSGEDQFSYMKLDALEFMRRFLQHVLPKGFIKVRYYGLFAPRKRSLLDIAKKLIGVLLSVKKQIRKVRQILCPVCGNAMFFLTELKRMRGPPLQALFNGRSR